MCRIDICDRISYNVAMQLKKQLALLIALILVQNCLSSGFGLYEMSAASHALGGAVVGQAVDGSANFFNPATLSDMTNITVSAGFVTQHPRARIKVDGESSSSAMNPGVFWLPHLQLAVPLPAGFTFGLGSYVECGLGSEYDDNWALVNSSLETTVQSLTLNPNLSYAITDRWSVGAGFRFFYFDFEQYSHPVPGRVRNRLKGDNDFSDWGWQVGTRYRLFDNFAVGLVYKSMINVNVDGKSQTEGAVYRWTSATTDLDMPESIAGGFNWDITDTWHLGSAFTWTKWSSFDTLNFNLGGAITPVHLNWVDTYRIAVAPSWDFAEHWSAMLSYAYETDCTGDQESTMLPCADRHMITSGLRWNCWENIELALSYGIIIMDARPSQDFDATGKLRHYCAYRGISHAVGFTITYRF